MESIIRNVRDLDSDKRQSLEEVLGRELRDDQQLIIQVLTPDLEPDAARKLEALERAQALANKAARHRESLGVSAAEADQVVDEAIEQVRLRTSH